MDLVLVGKPHEFLSRMATMAIQDKEPAVCVSGWLGLWYEDSFEPLKSDIVVNPALLLVVKEPVFEGTKIQGVVLLLDGSPLRNNQGRKGFAAG